MALKAIPDPGRFSRVPLADPATGRLTTDGVLFLQQLYQNLGGANLRQVGSLRSFTTTVGQAALASAAEVTLLAAETGEQWLPREIFLSGAGTDFSGGGDRLLDVTDGTTIWSSVPAATLQSLAAARWGDTGAPFPATAAHLTTTSVLSTDLVAKYSGGASDYTAGSCTVVLIAERTG